MSSDKSKVLEMFGHHAQHQIIQHINTNASYQLSSTVVEGLGTLQTLSRPGTSL